MNGSATYRLWSGNRGAWCDLDLIHTSPTALQAMFPPDWNGRHTQIDFDVEIAPEADGPQGQWSLAVRRNGLTLGYLPDGRTWSAPIRRIVASGLRPVTNGQVWGYENGWNEPPFQATARVNVGDPQDAYPINDPPPVPYTLLPRGGIAQVTKEEDHTDALLKYVPARGRGLVIVTLHEHTPARGAAKPHVEIRINNERIGQFTPQTSQRFLPMIRHFEDRGLVTAARGDIEGSQVAAEVRVESIKANEADDQCLNGTPVTIPQLVPVQQDPLAYDLDHMSAFTRKVAPPPARVLPAEPPDGALIRFASGRYVYIAVRRGTRWETTATGSGGKFQETMTWGEIASRIRTFEMPTGWERVTSQNSHRVRSNNAVVHFHTAGHPMAALCVRDSYESWYGTMTEALEDRLPLDKHADWPEIAAYGHHHHLVTGWRRYP